MATKQGVHVPISHIQPGFAHEAPEAVITLDLSRDGRLLAVGTVEDIIVVLDATTGQQLVELEGHAGGTNSLRFMSNVDLASAGEDGCVRLWDAVSGKLIKAFDIDGIDADKTPDGHTVGHIAVSPDGKAFACAAGKSVHLISVTEEDTEHNRKVASTVEDIKFTRDGWLLVAYYGGVTYWSPNPDDDGLELPYPGSLLAIDVDRKNEWFVAGCHDATVHIWHLVQDPEDGKYEMQELTCGGYETKVTKCDFDRDGRFLSSTGGDRATVWDFAAGGPAGSVPICTMGHRTTITCQAWQQDFIGLLATGGKDGRLFIYDVRHFKPGRPNVCLPLLVADSKDDEVTQVVWAPGNVIYTGHMSGHVRQWLLPKLEQAELDEAAQAALDTYTTGPLSEEEAPQPVDD